MLIAEAQVFFNLCSLRHLLIPLTQGSPSSSLTIPLSESFSLVGQPLLLLLQLP